MKQNAPDPNYCQRLREALRAHPTLEKPQDLANKSGVSKATISKYLHGNTTVPDYSKMRPICQVLGVDVDYILYGGPQSVAVQPKPSGVAMLQVPVVGIAQLGEGGYWEEWDLPTGGGDEVLTVASGDPNAYSLQVRGDSMHPAIRDGWYVVAEPNREAEPGEYVIVKTRDGQSMVKEMLWNRRGQVALESVNAEYPRLTLQTDEIVFIHPVATIASPASVRIRD